jgi:hypothetical protein
MGATLKVGPARGDQGLDARPSAAAVGGPQTNFTRDRMDIENLNGRVVLEGTMPR